MLTFPELGTFNVIPTKYNSGVELNSYTTHIFTEPSLSIIATDLFLQLLHSLIDAKLDGSKIIVIHKHEHGCVACPFCIIDGLIFYQQFVYNEE